MLSNYKQPNRIKNSGWNIKKAFTTKLYVRTIQPSEATIS